MAAIVLSFVVGRRFGRGVWSSAWRGLSVIGLFMLVTVWGAQRLHDLHTLTPEDPTFRIVSAQVLRGERWALAMVGKHAAPQQVWAIDLMSGTYRPIPPPDASLLWNTRGGWLGNGANHLRSVSMKPSRIGVVSFIEGFGESRIFVYRWFDGFTGTVSKTLPASVPYPEIDGLHEEELREWTTVRASDGRRAWLCRRPGEDHRGALGYAVEQPDGSVKRHVVGAGVQPFVETDWGWLASTGWRAKEIFIIAPFEHHSVRVVRLRQLDGKRFRTLWGSVVTAPAPDRILLRFGNRIYWMDREGNLTEHTIEGLTNFGQSIRQIDDRRRVRALRDGKDVYLYFDVDTGEYEERAERRPPLLRSLGDGRYLALDGKNVVKLAESVHGPLTDLPNAEGLLLVGQVHDCSVLAVQNGKRIVRYDYRTGKIERIWPKNGGVRE